MSRSLRKTLRKRRYITFTVAILATLLFLALATVNAIFLLPAAVGALLVALGVHDLLQPSHSIPRSYPIVAHLRFLFEDMRPEIRQYFLESDTDGTPFRVIPLPNQPRTLI